MIRLVTTITILMLTVFCAESQEKPKKPFQLFEEAERVYNDGDYQKALTLLNACLQLNAGYMEAYTLRGAVKEMLKDYDGALTDYSIYLDRYPDQPEALMSRGVLRFTIGFYDQAKEDFRRLLHTSPKETNAVFLRRGMSVDDRNPVVTTSGGGHNSYVYNYLGLIELKQEKPRLAIAYFDSAIRVDKRDADFYVNRGIAKETLGDTTAITDYDHALSLHPEHALARHNLEAYQAKIHAIASREERLTHTITADSTLLYPYLERAQERFANGDYNGAIVDYNKSLTMDSENIEIWLGRGLAREKLNDLEGAFSDYTKAIDLRENYAKAWLNRGNVLLKMNRYEDAIEDYNVALIYYSDYASAYFNRAIAKVKLKKFDEACTDLKHAEAYGLKIDEKLKRSICEPIK